MVCVAVMACQTYHRGHPPDNGAGRTAASPPAGTLRLTKMDPASGIGIPVAFGAGLISFLSPCVLPLVPGYISAVAGVAPGEIRPSRGSGSAADVIESFSALFIAVGE